MFKNFFPQNRAVYEIMWKNMLQPDRPQMTIKNDVFCTLDKYGYRHKLRIYNNYCFSTATMVTRTRLNITLYAHCLPFLLRD